MIDEEFLIKKVNDIKENVDNFDDWDIVNKDSQHNKMYCLFYKIIKNNQPFENNDYHKENINKIIFKTINQPHLFMCPKYAELCIFILIKYKYPYYVIKSIISIINLKSIKEATFLYAFTNKSFNILHELSNKKNDKYTDIIIHKNEFYNFFYTESWKEHKMLTKYIKYHTQTILNICDFNNYIRFIYKAGKDCDRDYISLLIDNSDYRYLYAVVINKNITDLKKWFKKYKKDINYFEIHKLEKLFLDLLRTSEQPMQVITRDYKSKKYFHILKYLIRYIDANNLITIFKNAYNNNEEVSITQIFAMVFNGHILIKELARKIGYDEMNTIINYTKSTIKTEMNGLLNAVRWGNIHNVRLFAKYTNYNSSILDSQQFKINLIQFAFANSDDRVLKYILNSNLIGYKLSLIVSEHHKDIYDSLFIQKQKAKHFINKLNFLNRKININFTLSNIYTKLIFHSYYLSLYVACGNKKKYIGFMNKTKKYINYLIDKKIQFNDSDIKSYTHINTDNHILEYIVTQLVDNNFIPYYTYLYWVTRSEKIRNMLKQLPNFNEQMKNTPSHLQFYAFRNFIIVYKNNIEDNILQTKQWGWNLKEVFNKVLNTISIKELNNISKETYYSLLRCGISPKKSILNDINQPINKNLKSYLTVINVLERRINKYMLFIQKYKQNIKTQFYNKVLFQIEYNPSPKHTGIKYNRFMDDLYDRNQEYITISYNKNSLIVLNNDIESNFFKRNHCVKQLTSKVWEQFKKNDYYILTAKADGVFTRAILCIDNIEIEVCCEEVYVNDSKMRKKKLYMIIDANLEGNYISRMVQISKYCEYYSTELLTFTKKYNDMYSLKMDIVKHRQILKKYVHSQSNQKWIIKPFYQISESLLKSYELYEKNIIESYDFNKDGFILINKEDEIIKIKSIKDLTVDLYYEGEEDVAYICDKNNNKIKKINVINHYKKQFGIYKYFMSHNNKLAMMSIRTDKTTTNDLDTVNNILYMINHQIEPYEILNKIIITPF